MSKSRSSQDYRIVDCRSTLRKMYTGQATTDEAAKCILSSGWNFRDPKQRMNKDTEEVATFLENVCDEIGLYAEMQSEGRKSLFRMICDAYCRALAENRGP